MNQFTKTEQLIGSTSLKKLKMSHVAVFGVGGVGGYVCEMLVRAGVGEITIIDADKVDITNINRQIIALSSTVGQFKVEVLKQRLLDINPTLKINAVVNRVSAENVQEMLNNNFDYVVDAIDNVTDKISLITTALNLNLPIVSAMGAGNRTDIPQFEVADIFATYNDGLAKIMRKKLKEHGVVKHNVVFTKNAPQKNQESVGSISYYPSMCGCVLAAFVINELLK